MDWDELDQGANIRTTGSVSATSSSASKALLHYFVLIKTTPILLHLWSIQFAGKSALFTGQLKVLVNRIKTVSVSHLQSYCDLITNF